MYSLRFPYQHDTLNGVFGIGIRKLKLDIKYEASLSSTYLVFSIENCFDGNFSTFCHTPGEAELYMTIHFLDLPFKIEGIAMQNRNGSYWDPLNYVIQTSHDGKTFSTIKEFNDNSDEVCKSLHIRTRRVRSSSKYEYFRFRQTTKSCNTNEDKNLFFNLAEFDLFGSFGDNLCDHMRQRKTVYLANIRTLILIVFLS